MVSNFYNRENYKKQIKLIFILLSSLIFNISGRLLSAVEVNRKIDTEYLVSDRQALICLMLYIIVVMFSIPIWKIFKNPTSDHFNLNAAIIGLLLSVVGCFYSDVFYLFEIAKYKNMYYSFVDIFSLYIRQEWWFYALLTFCLLIMSVLKIILYSRDNKYTIDKKIKPLVIFSVLLSPIIFIFPLRILNIFLFFITKSHDFIEIPVLFSLAMNTIYVSLSLVGLTVTYYFREKNEISIRWLKDLLNISSGMLIATIIFQIVLITLPFNILFHRIFISNWQVVGLAVESIKSNLISFLPLLFYAIYICMVRDIIKWKLFDDESVAEQTSGNFGTASWATKMTLEKINFNSDEGTFIGLDDHGKSIYLPLLNKLTISPSGGGKTSCSSIPILLSHNAPAFVFDIKGELWAVTARYRTEVLGRDVIVIDPFGVTKTDDFKKGKPDLLLKEFRLNPFDWIPEDKRQRDRMINAFAASFVINEGGTVRHFDDNAKILIRGYIDYIMSLSSTERNLAMLYRLMSENFEEAQTTFDQMAQLDGRAGAAANQILRVGSDERGSILSTSYRQIDWMGDSNIQQTLSESNFNLKDFLKGNMDIFIVLPEDQVQEHSRLVRMILSLLMGMIVSATPNELPKKKMLYLLEELAQLGYTPDVEKCIEVLRARGVVVWSVFQTLSQIEMFDKPDLFKGVALKQIFTNDDTDTMQWIQTLGGKKTVLTKTLSINKGDSRQKMQAFGGTASSGEGESIHETGVDLIQINEIREMPVDEQFVFLHGTKPIRCKKVRYFEHPDFAGKFDINPLESRVN